VRAPPLSSNDADIPLRHLHACIEALRIAFSDGNWFVSDPSATRIPTAQLLSPAYLSTRAALFSRTQALPATLSHGSPAHTASDTVYFCATDAAGNAASFINSNYAGFGTAIVPPACGFTLQNRGAGFSLSAANPNAYAPGKRPYHTIIPGMATHADDGGLAAAFGVMGGFMQPQGHVQVLLNTWVFGMDAQDALDAPRFCIGEGMPGEAGNVGGQVVYLEEGIAESVVEGLRVRGHVVQVVGGQARTMFGRGQIIRTRVEDGVLVFSAGSDPRADGAAIPMI
jgi:gamma-glutamyltranspeptidase / glutathione hydrolase